MACIHTHTTRVSCAKVCCIYDIFTWTQAHFCVWPNLTQRGFNFDITVSNSFTRLGTNASCFQTFTNYCDAHLHMWEWECVCSYVRVGMYEWVSCSKLWTPTLSLLEDVVTHGLSASLREIGSDPSIAPQNFNERKTVPPWGDWEPFVNHVPSHPIKQFAFASPGWPCMYSKATSICMGVCTIIYMCVCVCNMHVCRVQNHTTPPPARVLLRLQLLQQ